jgi:hypothetical protein
MIAISLTCLRGGYTLPSRTSRSIKIVTTCTSICMIVSLLLQLKCENVKIKISIYPMLSVTLPIPWNKTRSVSIGYDCERIDVSSWSMHAAPMELRGQTCFIHYAACETALRYTHNIRASRGAAMLSRQVCARKTYAWPCLPISPAPSLSKIYISHSRPILTVYCLLCAGCVVCNILAKTNIDVIRACIVATKIPV